MISFSAFGQWNTVSSPTEFNLYGAYFWNVDTGFIAGSGLYKTSNGGSTWVEAIVDPIDTFLYRHSVFSAIECPSETKCYASGWHFWDNDGIVMKSEDGGENWEVSFKGGLFGRGLNSICFIDENIGFVAGDGGWRMKTTNGGNSWTTLSSITNHDLHTILFFNSNLGFSGGDNVILKTTNGGTSWTTYNIPNESISQFQFITASKIYAIGSKLYKTEDGGDSWSVVNDQYGRDLKIFNDSTGFILANNKIVRSIDSFVTWEDQPSSQSISLQDFHWVDQSNCYGVGWDGRIIKTTNGGGAPIPFVEFSPEALQSCPDSTISFYNHGVSSYNWEWFINGISIASTYNSSYNFSSTGEYSVSLIGSNSYFSDTFGLTITINDPPIADAGVDLILCYGTQDQLNVSGGTGSGTTYRWEPSIGLDNVNIANPTVNVNHTTVYSVTVTSSSGCSTVDSIVVFVEDSIEGEHWEAEDTVFTQETMVIEFTGPNIGYIYCDGGNVFKTLDGGQSWTQLIANSGTSLSDIQFFNPEFGYIGARHLYKTFDGGKTLIDVSPPVFNGYNRSIHFISPDSGYVITKNGLNHHFIHMTTDGGQSWTEKYFYHFRLFDIFCVDMDTCYCTHNSNTSGSQKGRILKTNNGGEDWFWLDLPGNNGWLHNIEFILPSTGFAVGGIGEVLRTLDYGKTWQIYNLQSHNTFLHALCFTDKDTGYIGGNGQWFKTVNGGDCWQPMGELPTTLVTYDIEFPLNNVGYAAATNGFNIGKIISTKPIKMIDFKLIDPTPCVGDSIALYNYSVGYTSYQWFVNDILHDTSMHSGFVFDSVTSYKISLVGFTGSAYDTIHNFFMVDSYPVGEILQGDSIAICDTVALSATPGYNYKWSTGENLDSVNVSEDGEVFLSISTNNGCTIWDTIVVFDISHKYTIGAYPNPVCATDSIYMAASPNVGHGFEDDIFSWSPDYNIQTTTNSQVYANPDTSTLYTLTVYDTITGCFTSKEVFVEVRDTPCCFEGPYSVGDSLSDFTSLSEALNLLSSFGICGSVYLNIKSGVYNEKVLLPEIDGASSVNRIFIQSEELDPDSVVFHYNSASLSDNYVFRFLNADYYTVQYLTFEKLGSNKYGCCISFQSNCTNNEIKYCSLSGQGGFGSSEDDDNVIWGNGSNMFNLIADNSIHSGANGIKWEGSILDSNNVISGNLISGQLLSCIDIDRSHNLTISQNDLEITSVSSFNYILDCNTLTGKFVIEKNRITSLSNAKPGINIHNSHGSALNYGIVKNNFVQTYRDCILNDDSYFVKYYFNTAKTSTTSSSTSCFNLTGYGSDDIIIKNNIFDGGSYGKSMSVFLSQISYESDFNCFWGTSSLLFRYIGTQYEGLEEWRTVTGEDANSIFAFPEYVSSLDLHITSVYLNEAGTPLTSVTEDIDGNSRDLVSPDIGADEFFPLAMDVGIEASNELSSKTCEGNLPLSIWIKNHDNIDLTSVVIQASINSIQLDTMWTGILPFNDSTLFHLTDIDLVDTDTYNIEVNSIYPNSRLDTIEYNNDIHLTLYPQPDVSIFIDTSLCDGDSIFVNGNWRKEAGIYMDSFITTSTCDSIINYSVSLIPQISDTFYLQACDSVIWNNKVYYNSGIYTDTLVNTNNCDSIVSLDLEIDTTIRYLQGHIYTSTGSTLSNSLVYLVELSINDSTLSFTDLTQTDINGKYMFETSATNVYLKAVPDSLTYPNQMPTYYDSSLTFLGASEIELMSCDTIEINLKTIQGVNPGGPGFIGGKISEGAGKVNSCDGTPITNLTLFLISNQDQPVAYTTTNGNGEFSFGNIPLGTYELWADHPQIDNSEAPMITLDNENQQLGELELKFTANKLELCEEVYIAQLIENSTWMIYPNPYTGQTNIAYSISQKSNVSLELFNTLGEKIKTLDQGIKSANSYIYPFSAKQLDFASGVYFVKLTVGDQIYTKRLVELE